MAIDEFLSDIVDLKEYPSFLNKGDNDIEGTQIFTPKFIVDNMIKIIGKNNIINLEFNILEPASGDGAFTVRILELRLNSLLKKDYLYQSLTALSTIYAIELDQGLLIKQRNNIFSLLMFYLRKNKITPPEEYVYLAKRIIECNFIWGETNITNSKDNIIGWFMPIPINKNGAKSYHKAREIVFTKWLINRDLSFETVIEKAEFSVDDTPITGGLFG